MPGFKMHLVQPDILLTLNGYSSDMGKEDETKGRK